jgi:hypothetical protein
MSATTSAYVSTNEHGVVSIDLVSRPPGLSEDDETLLLEGAMASAHQLGGGRIIVNCEGFGARDSRCVADILRLSRIEALWRRRGTLPVTFVQPSSLVLCVLRTLGLYDDDRRD